VVAARPLPVLKPVAAPKPVVQTSAKTGRFLQLGAFSSAANADKMRAKVSAAARVAPVEQGGSTLYRVLVGPLPDEAAMALAKTEAQRLGVAQARTVTLN
jgi:rare lipoprotein A